MLENHGPGGKEEEIQNNEKKKEPPTRLAGPIWHGYYQRANWTMGIAYGRVASPCSSVGSMTATPQLRLHVPLVAFYDRGNRWAYSLETPAHRGNFRLDIVIRDNPCVAKQSVLISLVIYPRAKLWSTLLNIRICHVLYVLGHYTTNIQNWNGVSWL